MSFRKTSLKSRQRKKKILSFGKKIGIAGTLIIGMAFLLPKAAWNTLGKKKHSSRHIKLRIFFGIVFVFLALFIGLLWTDSGKQAGKDMVKDAIFALGADLPKDKNGFTNFLILGSGGGESHSGKGHKLTDSIMIVSADIAGRSVVIASIPRDLYIETKHVRGRINEIIRDESQYFLKDIKHVPENAAMLKSLSGMEHKKFMWKLEAQADALATEVMRKKIEEIFQMDIHRTARIDFQGFEKFVDAVGGIDVFVEKTIIDPTYPDFDWGYDPFRLEAGEHHLDGVTALKYARSRHDSSDFDRAKRQQNVISALKEKMTSLEILTSPSKLKKIFDVIQENYISDISWNEMITLAKFADKLPRDQIFSFVLNDDPTKPGGFLVTPSRELYGGAFVLVPFLNLENDKFARIRIFARMIFDYRNITGPSGIPITILNATNRTGIAGQLAVHLERFGWTISTIDNADVLSEETIIRCSDTVKAKETAQLLQSFFPAKIEVMKDTNVLDNSTDASPDAEEVIVSLGSEYEKPYRIPKISLSQ